MGKYKDHQLLDKIDFANLLDWHRKYIYGYNTKISINNNFIKHLFRKQGGKCALTNIVFTYSDHLYITPHANLVHQVGIDYLKWDRGLVKNNLRLVVLPIIISKIHLQRSLIKYDVKPSTISTLMLRYILDRIRSMRILSELPIDVMMRYTDTPSDIIIISFSLKILSWSHKIDLTITNTAMSLHLNKIDPPTIYELLSPKFNFDRDWNDISKKIDGYCRWVLPQIFGNTAEKATKGSNYKVEIYESLGLSASQVSSKLNISFKEF